MSLVRRFMMLWLYVQQQSNCRPSCMCSCHCIAFCGHSSNNILHVDCLWPCQTRAHAVLYITAQPCVGMYAVLIYSPAILSAGPHIRGRAA